MELYPYIVFAAHTRLSRSTPGRSYNRCGTNNWSPRPSWRQIIDKAELLGSIAFAPVYVYSCSVAKPALHPNQDRTRPTNELTLSTITSLEPELLEQEHIFCSGTTVEPTHLDL